MIANAHIRAQLNQHREELPHPAAIAGWEIKVGRDATGESAVWVWIVLHDDLAEQVWPIETRIALQKRVEEIVERAASPEEVLVYVRVRYASEYRELASERWAP